MTLQRPQLVIIRDGTYTEAAWTGEIEIKANRDDTGRRIGPEILM